MRVLWFLNTPFSGTGIGSHVAGGRGGWLSNLAGLVRADVELSIAYVDPYAPRCMSGGGVTAYAIRPRAWKARLISRSLLNHRPLREFSVAQMQEVVDLAAPSFIHIHGTEKGYIELLGLQSSMDVPILISLQGIMQRIAQVYPGGYDQVFLRNFWYDRGGRIASALPKRLLVDWRYALAQAAREEKFLPLARYIDGRTNYDRTFAGLMAPRASYFHVDRVLRSAFLQKTAFSYLHQSETVVSTLSDSLLKGFDLVAEAAKLIRRIRPNFRWLVAGISNTSKTVAAARKRMGRSFPESNLELLGSVGPDALAALLMRASAFVLPSYAENSPNSLAEAQILGVPCVATDVGGVSSYVENDVTGVLVPSGDALALAGAILELLGDRARAVRLGSAGRQVAIERHDPTRIRRQLLDAYGHILAASGAASDSNAPSPPLPINR